MLPAAGVVLVVCAILAELVDRVTTRAATPAQAAVGEQPLGKEGGFELIFKDRYLLLIAVLTVLLNVVNTSGEYLFGRYIVEQAQAQFFSGPESAAARERFVGESYSSLFSTVNLIGFLLQMFVVSRLFKFLGIGRSLFIHPTVAFIGYLMMLRAPSVQLMGWLKVADNSIDYSLGNTTKQALWLPTSREAKYKAKQAVDSFFVRAGDVDPGGLRLRGRALAADRPRVCGDQSRSGGRVARRGRTTQRDAVAPSGRARSARFEVTRTGR
jgi:ATP:ADP antiporter, AAA family